MPSTSEKFVFFFSFFLLRGWGGEGEKPAEGSAIEFRASFVFAFLFHFPRLSGELFHCDNETLSVGGWGGPPRFISGNVDRYFSFYTHTEIDSIDERYFLSLSLSLSPG